MSGEKIDFLKLETQEVFNLSTKNEEENTISDQVTNSTTM